MLTDHGCPDTAARPEGGGVSAWTDPAGVWIEIVTTMRSYCCRGGARIPWQDDEEVISIDLAGSAA